LGWECARIDIRNGERGVELALSDRGSVQSGVGGPGVRILRRGHAEHSERDTDSDADNGSWHSEQCVGEQRWRVGISECDSAGDTDGRVATKLYVREWDIARGIVSVDIEQFGAGERAHDERSHMGDSVHGGREWCELVAGADIGRTAGCANGAGQLCNNRGVQCDGGDSD